MEADWFNCPKDLHKKRWTIICHFLIVYITEKMPNVKALIWKTNSDPVAADIFLTKHSRLCCYSGIVAINVKSNKSASAKLINKT